MHRHSAIVRLTVALVAAMAAVSFDVQADEKQPLSFIDPEDGHLDMSDFLIKHKGAVFSFDASHFRKCND
jgi:hypothetical protein